MDYIFETDKIYAKDKNGKIIAKVTFPDGPNGTSVINHTFVDPSLRGKGVAAELMKMADEHIKKQGKVPVPQCSYAVKWYNEK